MPESVRVQKMTFVLIPDADSKIEQLVFTAKTMCRIAHQMGLKPISPLLYYLTYMAPGEYSMEQKRLSQQWLRRADRIWLQFPEDREDLDGNSFDILSENQRLARRRPVYQVHQIGEEFIPVPIGFDEIEEILNINLTAGLARCCV